MRAREKGDRTGVVPELFDLLTMPGEFDMRIKKDESQRPRRHRSRRTNKVVLPTEICPCIPSSVSSGVHVYGIVHYYALEKQIYSDTLRKEGVEVFDVTHDEFVEYCHPLSKNCDTGDCGRLFHAISDYQEEWIKKSERFSLQVGGIYRVPGITWKEVVFASAKKISEWIAWTESGKVSRFNAK